MKITQHILTAITLSTIGCTQPATPDQANEENVPVQHYFTYDAEHLFPGDGSLNRAEDGVVLPDGRIVVIDQVSGLRLLDDNGQNRPFGNFKAAGYVHDPPEILSAPNGVVLEQDGIHLLVSDVFTGKLYRINTETEAVEMFYNHPFGVNTLYSDKSGAIWFTQSAENTNMSELFQDINLPVPSGAVYRMADLNSEPVKIIDSLYFANGITMNHSETHLYVAETMMDRIQSFEVDVAKGELINQSKTIYVPTPDNISFDQKGRLLAACPVFNQVVVVDLKQLRLAVLFNGSSPKSSSITREWMLRSLLNMERLELFTPDLYEPLPGAITGMFFSRDYKTLYISNLGNDLLRYDLSASDLF